MSKSKRSASPLDPSASSPTPSSNPTLKRSKPDSTSTPSTPLSLHAWLHPSLPSPLLSPSRALHESTSTFLSISLSFLPPGYVTTVASLTKEAARVVRQLDVVSLVGAGLVASREGAFENGEGRAKGVGKGKERAREPDHRMWAVRTVCLKQGKNGTGGEEDYQLLEISEDDGEKHGGDHVLRVLRESQAIDVLTICCRWYGGDMIGPIRFQHIRLTAQHSINDLVKLVKLRDLRSALVELDTDIASLRGMIAAGAESESAPVSGSTVTTASTIPGPGSTTPGKSKGSAAYDEIDDIPRLERLVKAKEKTRGSLQDRAGWAAFDQSRLNIEADAAV